MPTLCSHSQPTSDWINNTKNYKVVTKSLVKLTIIFCNSERAPSNIPLTYLNIDYDLIPKFLHFDNKFDPEKKSTVGS